MLFPILKSLYGSKSLDRPELGQSGPDHRQSVLLLSDRLARSDILEQLYLVETVLNLLGDWMR